MKVKKISVTLFFNYVLLFFLILFVIGVTLFVLAVVQTLYSECPEPIRSDFNAHTLIKDDYNSINCNDLLKIGGWMEVLDDTYTVLLDKKSPKPAGYTYTKEEFNNLVFRNNETSEYKLTCAYNNKNKFYVISVFPSRLVANEYDTDDNNRYYPNVKGFWLIAGFTFSGLLVLAIALYSILTSRTIVRPLRSLLNGVNKIAGGDYSTRIQLNNKNEIGQLKNAINLMAQKIEDEINLRKESEENRKRLILDISHDLKNPLTSTLGYSELLLDDQLKQDKKQKYLKIINSNSKRANTLIQDLFALSKIENADFKLECHRNDVCEFLRRLLAGYIPLFEENNHSYEFEIPEQPIMFDFDKTYMERALANLIMNSIKYAGDGARFRLSVQYTPIENAKWNLQIVVEDDGLGIPDELAKDIFQPFVRVDDSRNSKSGGTGLGLAITKAIIEKHGGTINLISHINAGSKFIIQFRAK